jgi:predicted hydrocarbon binding protein
MTYNDFTVELLREWVKTLLTGLEDKADAGTRARLLTACGKTCAVHHGDLEEARRLRGFSGGIDELLVELNRQVGWCGEWRREGDTITSICTECGCPLVREGLVQLSPTFCECSRGFVKALFETVLDKPVMVELKQAIGRGDPVCEFAVRYG